MRSKKIKLLILSFFLGLFTLFPLFPETNNVTEFPSGDWYFGAVDDQGNILDGEGTLMFADGTIYKGSFVHQKRNGEGIMLFPNGAEYSGNWNDDLFNGYGTYSDETCTITGTFTDGSFQNGLYTIKSNDFTYKITYPSKKVVITSGDGTTYSGSFTNQELTGIGMITYSNSDTYSGQIVKGKRSGIGNYIYQNGSRVRGKWLDDKWKGSL